MRVGPFLFLLTFFPLCGFAQDWTAPVRDTSHFPVSWEGTWSGELAIHFPGREPRRVAMALEILPVDSATWTWTLIYGEGEQADRRPYLLKPIDVANGRWVVDEQNGIVLGSRQIGPAFLSLFAVQGQLLSIGYTEVAGTLHFTVLSGDQNGTMTGGEDTDQKTSLDAIPPVEWFEVGVWQEAILRRNSPADNSGSEPADPEKP